MMGTKRMAHFTTRCQERGDSARYRFTWDASQITAAHAAAVEFRLETNRIPDDGATPDYVFSVTV